jgi:hypothetical protein
MANIWWDSMLRDQMEADMLKKSVYLILFILINMGFLLAVQGGNPQNPRFTVSGDCVNDNQTGLMWAKNGNLPNGPRDWQGALDYVSTINSGSGLCGYKDWRLPNVNELESLTKNAGEADTGKWLMTQGFSNVQAEYYWSSSDYPASPDLYAWVVPVSNFSPINHTMNVRKRQKTCYVWPVRSGK